MSNSPLKKYHKATTAKCFTAAPIEISRQAPPDIETITDTDAPVSVDKMENEPNINQNNLFEIFQETSLRCFVNLTDLQMLSNSKSDRIVFFCFS